MASPTKGKGPKGPGRVVVSVVNTEKKKTAARLAAASVAAAKKKKGGASAVAKVKAAASSPIGGSAKPSPSMRKHTGGRLTRGPAGVGLSECALNYAKALANPFGGFDELPCVPDAPPVPSYRFRAVTRGTFSTGGAAGNNSGFVCIIPRNCGNATSTVFTSFGAYAGSSFSKTVGATVAGAPRSSLPFVAAAFDGIQGRLVGLGIRTRNISQALNVGGILTGIQADAGEDISTWTAAQVTSDPRSVLLAQALEEQTKWCTLVWRPTDISDLDYVGGTEDFSMGTSPSMGFLVNGPGTTTQTYEFEIVEFWEFIGASATQGVRPPELVNSHADPVGLARVMGGIQDTPLTLDSKEWVEKSAQAIVESVAHSDSVSKTVEDLLGFAGMSIPAAMNMVKSLTSFLAL